MRLENEAPINDFEKSIETILVLNGYAESEIQFRDNNRYLRIGYWQQLTAKAAICFNVNSLPGNNPGLGNVTVQAAVVLNVKYLSLSPTVYVRFDIVSCGWPITCCKLAI